MTFAKTVTKELRATFGDKWISSVAHWAVVLCGLVVAGFVMVETVQLAVDSIAAPIAESLK